ncbi:MAG: VTT domain-containing protein [Candidatus Solibacter usitatus]|nr:VTT domain-containing protein [Candidatus Solibacter usitatus]
MTELWAFVLRHGYGLLFAAVLVEQLGAPVPAVPILLVMGALAGFGHYSAWTALLLAVVAALAADLFWFELGRRRGDSILALLCRLSLEPDSCVRQTSQRFDRWGPATLLVAKFIPGLSAVAPPLAGSARLSRWKFLLFDSAGAALWAGSALAGGVLLGRRLERAVLWLAHLGSGLLALASALLLAWIAWKLWHRRKTVRLLRVARVTPQELKRLLDAGQPVHIVDLRPPRSVQRSGVRLPGALILAPEQIDLRLRDLPSGAHLVFYCH